VMIDMIFAPAFADPPRSASKRTAEPSVILNTVCDAAERLVVSRPLSARMPLDSAEARRRASRGRARAGLARRLDGRRIHAVASFGLCPIERAVRNSDQRLGELAGPVLRDAEACCEHLVDTRYDDSSGEIAPQMLGERDRARETGAGQDDRELLAADSRGEVGFAHAFSDHIGGRAQDVVSLLMA
jgi:hypothetical protein